MHWTELSYKQFPWPPYHELSALSAVAIIVYWLREKEFGYNLLDTVTTVTLLVYVLFNGKPVKKFLPSLILIDISTLEKYWIKQWTM